MQWVDALNEFPYNSDCQPLSKKEAKKLQVAVVRDKSYLSKDKATRQAALKWLDCSASLNQNYKEFFLHALPGYLYLIPEVGRGLFLCISQVISYSNDILISADLYKNKQKFDRDVYVFVNSNVPDKPFFVTRRQLHSFFGRSPSEHVVKIIKENLDITIRTPEKLLSVVTSSDLFDTDGGLIDTDNQHDLTLIEQTIEDSIDVNPENPIDVRREKNNILELINSIHAGKVKNKKRGENPREIYIDKQLKILIEHLREKIDARAFAIIDPMILRSKIALLINENIKIQKKQTEDWYADETSLVIPENFSEKSEIENPNIPANNVETNSSNKESANLPNNVSLNEQALNSEERKEISDKKTQGWLGYLSSSIGWRGGTRKYKIYESSSKTRRAKRGGSAIVEGTLLGIGEKAAQFGKTRGLEHAERVGTKKNARRELVNNSVFNNISEDERDNMISEYDALYDKVYFHVKGETLEAEFKENLAKNLTEGAMYSSLSVATGSASTAAALTVSYLLGGNAAASLVTGMVSGSFWTSISSVATTTTVVAALPVLVQAAGAAAIAGALTAVVVTAVGGYHAGLSRAKQINTITKETVLKLTEVGVKSTNEQINSRIKSNLTKLAKRGSIVFNLNTDDAVKWMDRTALFMTFVAAGIGKMRANSYKKAEKERLEKEEQEKKKEAAAKKHAEEEAAKIAAVAKRKRAEEEAAAAAKRKHAEEEAAKMAAAKENMVRHSNSQPKTPNSQQFQTRRANKPLTTQQTGEQRRQRRTAKEAQNSDVYRNGVLTPRESTEQTYGRRHAARTAKQDFNSESHGVLTPRESTEQTYRRRHAARTAKQNSESYNVLTPQSPSTITAEEEPENNASSVGSPSFRGNNARSVGTPSVRGNNASSPLPNNNIGLSSELYKCGPGERFSVKEI